MHPKARWIVCSRVVFRRVPTGRLCSYEGWIAEERSTCLAVPSRLPCPYDVSLVSERCLYPMQQRAGTHAEGRLVTSERSVFPLCPVSLTCLKASSLPLVNLRDAESPGRSPWREAYVGAREDLVSPAPSEPMKHAPASFRVTGQRSGRESGGRPEPGSADLAIIVRHDLAHPESPPRRETRPTWLVQVMLARPA
jgi:hypothetical protein